ncbi:MAG: nitric oxide synthase [Desulfococcus sp. 4484_241]|nr:MAG: nitric oxide synthase [Desulfococcus sp. 4484_241]
MPKALVAYSTRTDNTAKIAEYIAEGLRFSAADVTLVNIKNIKEESQLEGYDIYVFGSPTYHGEMTNSMKTFLFLSEKADLAGKAGGSFGAFGWSGEAPERIYETMKNVFSMNMTPDGPLMLKSGDLEGGMKMAQAYGRKLGGMVA